MTPETIFERRWALTMLEEALAALESEFVTSGKGEVFRELQPFLCGEEAFPFTKTWPLVSPSAKGRQE